MKSQLEINQSLVKVGSILFYSDASNFEKYTVTELFDGGFECKDSEGNIQNQMFNELQKGWELKK